MSRRKVSEEGIRKLTKLGGASLAVTIPSAIIKKLGWKEKQKVVVKKIRGGMSVKNWKPKRVK